MGKYAWFAMQSYLYVYFSSQNVCVCVCERLVIFSILYTNVIHSVVSVCLMSPRVYLWFWFDTNTVISFSHAYNGKNGNVVSVVWCLLFTLQYTYYPSIFQLYVHLLCMYISSSEFLFLSFIKWAIKWMWIV